MINSTVCKKMSLCSLAGHVLVFGTSICLKSGYAACNQIDDNIEINTIYVVNIKAFLDTHSRLIGKVSFSSGSKEAYIQILNRLNEIYNEVQNT